MKEFSMFKFKESETEYFPPWNTLTEYWQRVPGSLLNTIHKWIKFKTSWYHEITICYLNEREKGKKTLHSHLSDINNIPGSRAISERGKTWKDRKHRMKWKWGTWPLFLAFTLVGMIYKNSATWYCNVTWKYLLKWKKWKLGQYEQGERVRPFWKVRSGGVEIF